MKSKIFMLILAIFMIGGMTQAAVIQVAAGTDVISAAYATAAAGDVIELTTGGGDGVYIESTYFTIDKDITIRAAAGLAEKPLYRSQDSSDPMFKITGANARLELQGIEFDGTDGAGANVAKYFVIVDNGDTLGTSKMIIRDCEAYEFTDKIIKLYGNSGVDSVVVDNSILHGGASEGICLYQGSSSDPAVHVRNAEITNTTIYDVEREAIKNQTYDGTKLRVDRCTFYDMGANDKKAMLYLHDSEDIIIKNCIFVKNENPDAEKCVDFEDDATMPQFHNNVIWNTTNYEIDFGTVFDTLHVDPMFADPDNGDFSLPDDSPLLTFADDGGAIGDPRWVPEAPAATVHYVAAGTDVISTALAAASAGDIIELTTGGLDGTYLESSKLVIDKDITIRAGNVSSRPVIRQTGSTSNANVAIYDDVHVTLDGLEFDGTDGAGSVATKYFIIVDTDDTTSTVELVVNDCEAYSYSDKIIKFYGNSGIEKFELINSILHDGASEGVCLYEGSSSSPAVKLKEVDINNTTIYATEREAIKAQTYTKSVIRIDRCTFYDNGANDKKAQIYINDSEDVIVKNSIFVKNENPDAEKFADFESSLAQFHHNVVWNTTNYDVDNATVSDTLHMNPGFADPDNGDFSLPEDSPLLTFADDGGAVGDSRWVPDVSGKKALNIFVNGLGSVTLDPPGGLYDEGTSVTMTATPDSLWLFDHWSDNVSVFPPNNPVAVVTVNDNMNVTAYFVPTLEEYTIAWDAIGLGHVEENHIGYFPVEGYWEGDTLELTAVADTSTWEFVKWINADSVEVSRDNPLVYPVTADTHFIAVFNSTLPQYTLDLTVTGSGDVSVFPKPVEGFTTYDQGTVVSLVAVENMGWEFSGYSGDLVTTVADTSVTMDADKAITATFTEMKVPCGDLMVDTTWYLPDAIEFATYNSNVKRIVLTQVGPYAPSEADRSDGKLPQLNIGAPITIVAHDTLTEKPVIKGWGEGGSEGLFRMRANGELYLKDLVVDGYFGDNKTKYIVRLDDGAPIENRIMADNVDFFGTKEAFIKFYSQVHVDSLILRNCTVHDIGKEGIYDNAAGTMDYLEITNTTFYDVARECVRLKVQTPVTVIDHVTVDSCGSSEGWKHAAFKFEVANDMSIRNSIIAHVYNYVYGYSLRYYGTNASVDNTIIYNCAEIDNNDGGIVGDDVLDVDPLFAYATPNDYTLKDSSVAYSMANDGTAAIGDLRWATSASPVTYNALNINVADHGKVDVSPAGMGKYYIDGTVVTLTANADTLYKFGEWSGDVTGTDNPVNITMDADKSVQASFVEAFYTVEMNVDMSYWAALEKFSVENDSVDMAGTFNGWGANPIWMSDEDGDSIYTASVKIDENYPNIEWKFRINGSWDDATCEFPGGGPNRIFTVTEDTSLTFWYNDEEFPPEGIIAGMAPEKYELCQNYPNPFNPTTTIQFALKNDGFTSLVVYDMLGREVATLVNREMKAGYHQVVFSDMSRLSSGVYIYKLISGDFHSIKKMMLLK